ncbi:MAG: M23 family metallopeptidase [Candidatus Neomarinimicrobiota bacterium]
MNRRKFKSNYNNYILISERTAGARQWQFSRGKIVTFASLAVVFMAVVLFLSADALTQILYKSKIRDLKNNYNHLTTTLVELQTRLETVSVQVGEIEAKDQAIRTYAGLPEIDADVRKVGIGGMRVGANNALNHLVPDVETRISELEMDVGEISRRVKLELSSYNTMVSKVKGQTDKLKFLPSIRPVNGGYLGSSFGYREDPFTAKVRFHYGQDFAVNRGTDIYSPADGIVNYSGNQGGYGKVIKLIHDDGFKTIYAHLSKILVKRGQFVKRGDLIGISGISGGSAGPHLHYEVHQYGNPQNPLDFFFSGYLK